MKKTLSLITLITVMGVAGCGLPCGCAGAPPHGLEPGSAEMLCPDQAGGRNTLTLQDPLEAFSNLAAGGLCEAEVLFSEEQRLRIPPGGHYQGIQCYCPDRQNSYLFLSHDSREAEAYLVVAARVSDNRWEAQSAIPIASAQGDAPHPLKHAGGFQVCGHYLAVGIEDNRAKKDSQVLFYDISNPLKPLKLNNLTISRRSEKEKKATAGAVAMIDCTIDKKSGYLVAVGNWDSRDLDFYFLEGELNELNESDSTTGPFALWNSEQADRSSWTPDQNWGSYQSINFIRDGDCNLYLVGTHTGGKLVGCDFADLFSVQFGADNSVFIDKLASEKIPMGLYLPWSRNAHLTYGGGIFVPHTRSLVLLATAKNISGCRLKITVGGSLP